MECPILGLIYNIVVSTMGLVVLVSLSVPFLAILCIFLFFSIIKSKISLSSVTRKRKTKTEVRFHYSDVVGNGNSKVEFHFSMSVEKEYILFIDQF